MSITITDPALLAQITQASGVVDVTDSDGRVIARLHIETAAEQLARYKCPYTAEQLAEFSKVRTGRPMIEVIRELEAQQGGP
jgi:hypothetical protein